MFARSAAFDTWKSNNGKKYKDVVEEQERFENFNRTIDFVSKFNKANRGTWMKIGPFADKSKAEFIKVQLQMQHNQCCQQSDFSDMCRRILG